MREIALQLGPLVIRWYGVLWIAALALAWYLLPRLAKYRDLKLSKDDWWYVLAAGLVGAVVGGRLGYVLLWEPGYFLVHPAEVFAIWDGGMSSHGGFIGVGLALWWITNHVKSLRDHVVNFWALMDVIVIPVALGLALGRVGNFINQELFNPPELALLAVGKDLAIAGVCFWVLKSTPSRSLSLEGERPHPDPLLRKERGETKTFLPSSEGRLGGVDSGRVFALFLILYGILRFLVEFVRVQEFSGAFGLTRGQLLTLPLIAAGIWIWWARKNRLALSESVGRQER